MLEVNERTGETITLNTLIALNRVCIELVETPSPLMHIVKPGEHLSLLHGATGRILLAHLDPVRQRKVLGGAPTAERAGIAAELARFKQQGFGLTSGQRVAGVTAIAVPLFNLHDQVDACLALTGPSVRVDSHVTAFTAIMRKAGRDVSDRLGGRPPIQEDADA